MRFRIPNKRLGFPARFPVSRRRSGGRGKFKLWPILIFIIFAAVYYYSNQKQVPITGRSQLVTISREQEAALGLQSYQEILSQSRVVTYGPELEQIRRIGANLAKVIEPEYAKGFNWEFSLIDSEQKNAFCLPGGKVAVFSGILPVAANTDGLAVIMGHEIAHAVARHGAERMAQQQLQQWGTLALGMSVGEMAPETQRMVMGAFGLGSQFGILMPFSRKHESEADRMGLIYLARACYDPREAPRLWERMAAASQHSPTEFLSTHPNPSTRVKQFQEWMNEAMAVRAKWCQN